MRLTLTTNCEVPIKHTDNLRYPLTIPQFNWRHGTEEEWDSFTSYLSNVDWCQETQNMEVEDKINYFYKIMESAVEESF